MAQQLHSGTVPSEKRPRIILWILVLVLLVGTVLITAKSNYGLAGWLQWLHRTPVILYFKNPTGGYLVPVSRSLNGNVDPTQGLLAELLAGPAEDSGLQGLLPDSTRVQNFSLSGGVLRLDLSEDILGENKSLAIPSLWHSLTSLPEIQQIIMTIDGNAVTTPAPHSRMLFYHWRDRLVAQPIVARHPRELLNAYLQGPQDNEQLGLPTDVQVLEYQFDPLEGALSLDFSYTESLRQLGIDHPEATRNILLGLVTSLTQFPEIHYVILGFQGHSQLGLGQCASLIGAPQFRPNILNDERLLSRGQ